MSRARRWIAGIAVLVGLAVVPAALAVDAFGPVETADPELWVGALIPDSPQLAADGSGNAIFGSDSGNRMAVYERCGGSRRRGGGGSSGARTPRSRLTGWR